MTAQYFGHIGLVLSAITPPLALMLVDEMVVRQRRHPLTLGLLTAGLTVLQFFITQEVLLTEVIVAAILTIVLALSYRDRVRAHAGFLVRTLGIASGGSGGRARVSDVAAVPRARAPRHPRRGARHRHLRDRRRELRRSHGHSADLAAERYRYLVAFQRQRIGVGWLPGNPARADPRGRDGSILASAGGKDRRHHRWQSSPSSPWGPTFTWRDINSRCRCPGGSPPTCRCWRTFCRPG